jgi:hypothetical protein
MVTGRRMLCLGLALAGCAPEPAAALPAAPTLQEWARARRSLAGLEAEARTERIALTLREPRSGRVLSARGAVAILPPRALRMILLGPGGTTALDLWIDGDRWRFAVPAIDLVKGGDLRAPREERRGLPVDFLAFWLLHPTRGRLLWHAEGEAGERFVLRDGEAIVELHAQRSGGLLARRATWSTEHGAPELLDDERVTASGPRCAEVRYHQRSTGLDVTVRCEGETPGPPPARAFADPDGPPAGAEGAE